MVRFLRLVPVLLVIFCSLAMENRTENKIEKPRLFVLIEQQAPLEEIKMEIEKLDHLESVASNRVRGSLVKYFYDDGEDHGVLPGAPVIINCFMASLMLTLERFEFYNLHIAHLEYFKSDKYQEYILKRYKSLRIIELLCNKGVTFDSFKPKNYVEKEFLEDVQKRLEKAKKLIEKINNPIVLK